MKKDRILVTGGTGYIGSHTVVELQNAGYPVVIIDNLSNSNRDVLDGIERISGQRPDFVEADCTDMEALKKLFADYPDIRGIINFAASKAVGSETYPLLSQQPQHTDEPARPYGTQRCERYRVLFIMHRLW